ncbi:hypothetical protein BKA93DRAFT_204051 [Sparassis latifolia]
MSGEWYQWKKVSKYVASGHQLFRSSAPNYNIREGDRSQRLTAPAVKFLTDQGIDSIISFNEFSYRDDEKKLLADAKISYLHFSLEDYAAPTLAQLESAITFFTDPKQHSTLVHCGFGHGRTGTGVTALQLAATEGDNPTESEWMNENYVEEPVQMEVLRKLRGKLGKS